MVMEESNQTPVMTHNTGSASYKVNAFFFEKKTKEKGYRTIIMNESIQSGKMVLRKQQTLSVGEKHFSFVGASTAFLLILIQTSTSSFFFVVVVVVRTKARA